MRSTASRRGSSCTAGPLLVLTVLVAAGTTNAAVAISGAVANHVSKAFEAEVQTFQSQNADTSVTYTYQVSRVALQMLANTSIDFAITQNTAPNSSLCASHKLLSLPLLVGVGGFYHNVPGLSTPNMDACTVAGIFTGTIRMWNDPAIQKTNPGARLPSKPINIVLREDDGPVPLTLQLVQYINEQCPAVAAQLPSESQFPATFQRVVKIKEVVEVLSSIEYSFGYVQASSFPGGKEVAVQNRDGQFVTATSMDPASFAAALQEPSPSTCWGGVKTTNLPGAATHPMTFIIYFVAPSGRSKHGAAQQAVSRLAEQLLSPAAQSRAAALGFRPLPARLLQLSTATKSLLVPAKDSGHKRSPGVVAGIAVASAVGAALVGALVGLFVQRRKCPAGGKSAAAAADTSELVVKSTAPAPMQHGSSNMV